MLRWRSGSGHVNEKRKRLPFLVLDLGLDIIDRIRGLNLEGDGFTSKGLNEDLHGVQVMATGESLE